MTTPELVHLYDLVGAGLGYKPIAPGQLSRSFRTYTLVKVLGRTVIETAHPPGSAESEAVWATLYRTT